MNGNITNPVPSVYGDVEEAEIIFDPITKRLILGPWHPADITSFRKCHGRAGYFSDGTWDGLVWQIERRDGSESLCVWRTCQP